MSPSPHVPPADAPPADSALAKVLSAETRSAGTLTDDVRRVHAELSPAALALAEAAITDPDGCPPWPWTASGDCEWMVPGGERLQGWPTLVGSEKLAQIRRATEGVVALAKSLFERVFDGDPERIAEFYGLEDEILATLWLEPPNGLAGAVGRCDFIDGPAGFRCLELNLAGNVGGWVVEYAVPWWLRQPLVERVIESTGVRPVYRSPMEIFFAHVVRDVVGQGLTTGGRVDLAALVFEDCEATPEVEAELDQRYRRVVEGLDFGLTGSLILCRKATELSEGAGGELLAHGRRVHGLLEYNADLDTPRVAFRAFKAEQCMLYNGPVTRLLVDKRNLALLSELAESDRVDAEERSVLEDHVPWGRVVGDRRTRYRGEMEDLLPLLRARRGDFVLKRATGLGGVAVIVGRGTEAAAWETAVETAAASGEWMVQEFQESWPYVHLLRGGGWALHNAVWGTFCVGREYAGTFMRVAPRDGNAIVSVENGATGGVVFEV